jgi:hypothetical protein
MPDEPHVETPTDRDGKQARSLFRPIGIQQRLAAVRAAAPHEHRGSRPSTTARSVTNVFFACIPLPSRDP